MGLYMMSWASRVLILALAAGLLSCMKQPNMDEDLTPATLQEVQKAMATSWGQTSPLSMKVNDFVYTETDQRLEQQDPRVVLQEGITVSKKEETDKEVNYTYLYQIAVVTGDNAQQSTREDHRCVAKTDAGCAPSATTAPTPGSTTDPVPAVLKDLMALNKKAQAKTDSAAVKPLADDYHMSLGFEKFISLAYACEKTDTLDKYCKEEMKVDSCDIKCGNLKTADELVDAPSGMKQQPNCAGLKDCKINLKRVSFDWSLVTKTGTETHTQKVNYSIALSPDLPFLSRVIEYCSRSLYALGNTGNKALVTICNRTKNFKAAAN